VLLVARPVYLLVMRGAQVYTAQNGDWGVSDLSLGVALRLVSPLRPSSPVYLWPVPVERRVASEVVVCC
jgi:hypothetical protein